MTEAGTSPETRERPFRDAEVRSELRKYLQGETSPYRNMVLIEELGLCQGLARIDLLTVSGVLHGYEIKSSRDRLTRLASQAATYNRVLDRVTLVVCRRHVEAALQLVPTWWGVLLAHGSAEAVSLSQIRPAGKNPDQDPRALVELLWRDEALELLAHHNAAAGVRSKPRPAVWDRVCEVLEPTEIQSAVRSRLKTRRARATPA
ncbi:MAG: sce7726 family protein [Gemmatimonadota bacterium]|uniref:sce7726 family protein n=1 Tax=Candidatus Palauibacter scopulicola TaxID=3056741 RepID=UPI002390DD94|nr:sce7726 family protein [Candidatus Palauibacter scopulicola]MDE2662698.1 sce7726 family protein [Candidatus Palauibacter scopulicola]